jgi:anti-anti-sigma regulatory factor
LVGRVSTPCIQILLAAMAGAQLRGLPFKLREPSSMLAEALADLGLASHFGL